MRRRGSNPSRRGVLVGAASAALVAPAVLRAEAPFRLGLTPVFLDNDTRLLRELRGYLEARLDRPVRFVQRRTYREITNLALLGDLDAAWTCGYPYLQNRQRLALVAVPLWRGRPEYRSYLIIHAGRGVEALPELQGDVHAFSDPDSNSGYLVTVTDILGAGSDPEAFFSRSVFTYGHRNVVRAVGSALVQSGSVDGYVWEALAATEPGLTDRTRVLRRSEWMGFPPVVCLSEHEAAPVIEAFRQALLGMQDHPRGRNVLELLQLDGFTAGDERLFAPIAERMALLAQRG